MFTAQTEWSAPENYPDLKGYKYIAIDLETKDPNLKQEDQEPYKVWVR
jgi:hypothetical protein